MNLLTLGQCRASRQLNAIAGVCATSEEFASLVNDACQRALRRGDWEGTLIPIQVCVRRGCITWPREVETVRAINICGCPVPISNNWYQFLPGNQKNWWGTCRNNFSAFAESRMDQQVQVPSFEDLYGSGRYLRFICEKREDFGKTITVYGINDATGLPIRQKVNGIWIDGITLTLKVGFVSTTMTVRSVTRIQKDVTQGLVFGYGYNPTEDVMEPFGQYEPTETHPLYMRYKLSAPICTGRTGSSATVACGEFKSALALVKLAFIPAVADTDVVVIQNIDALKMLIQSIRFEEASDINNKRQYELDAIRELNLDINNIIPKENMAIEVRAFGSALPARAGVGMI